MSSGLHVVRAGAGPQILLIHGSAADHRTWSIQLASPLRAQFTLIAYDRRSGVETVEGHADDAAGLVAEAGGRAIAVGSSFGAVVALDLLRRYPGRVAGAVLIEPPLAPSDGEAPVATSFLPAFDRRAARDGGPAAGELFLRTVLGDAAFDRMPRVFQTAATMKFAEIRADTAALMAYRPRYAELAAVATPVLLLGGERSSGEPAAAMAGDGAKRLHPTFLPTLRALHAALGNARLEIVPAAGHMLHAEASRRFAALVTEFAAPLLGPLAPG